MASTNWQARVLTPLLGLLLFACLAACVPSLNPLSDARTAVDGSALLGVWRGAEGDVRFEFIAGTNPSTLRLIYVEKDNAPAEFAATTARLDGRLYLDIQPKLPPPYRGSGFVAHHVTAWHTFVRVQADKGQLRLSFASPQWLSAHLRSSPSALAHFRHDDEVVLTASTEQLQEFVIRHESWFSGTAAVLIKN